MTKVVHPYSHRIGILRDWKSKWFFSGSKYKDSLVSDLKLRKYLDKRLKGLFVSLVEIERSEKALRIILKTSRPGVIIGRSGEGAQKMKSDIEKFIRKNKLESSQEVKLDIVEVDNPDADAKIVAYSIVEGLEKRLPFRRVGKQVVDKVMSTRGVEGVRVLLSGRLGGADMARTEEIKKGSIPLQTFRADIDFTRERASLPYGDIGIKVWIYKGEVFKDNK